MCKKGDASTCFRNPNTIQYLPTGAGLHNHPQLWKPWPSSMIGVHSHWNSQFVDDLPIEYWCSTWCSSAALSERKKVGTIPEFNLIPRPVANSTSAVRRIAGNFLGSVKATGTHWVPLYFTRQHTARDLSDLSHFRPEPVKRCKKSRALHEDIEYYEPWYCSHGYVKEPKSKCCPFPCVHHCFVTSQVPGRRPLFKRKVASSKSRWPPESSYDRQGSR